MIITTDDNKPQRYNKFEQAIGQNVDGWIPRVMPTETPMLGQYCDVVRLDADLHSKALYQAVSEDSDGRHFTYLTVGPFSDFESFHTWLVSQAASRDPLVFAVLDKQSGKAIGMASYMRINPSNGVVEVGGIYFSPRLQKTPSATEAMYLMMKRAFDELGYRRYEWKCDSCNEPSKKAAQRFGFTFEGGFRQAIVYKGRNRDTAWYSILDSEWPTQRQAFETWLAPTNFDEQGQQLKSLAQCLAT